MNLFLDTFKVVNCVIRKVNLIQESLSKLDKQRILDIEQHSAKTYKETKC